MLSNSLKSCHGLRGCKSFLSKDFVRNFQSMRLKAQLLLYHRSHVCDGKDASFTWQAFPCDRHFFEKQPSKLQPTRPPVVLTNKNKGRTIHVCYRSNLIQVRGFVPEENLRLDPPLQPCIQEIACRPTLSLHYRPSLAKLGARKQ